MAAAKTRTNFRAHAVEQGKKAPTVQETEDWALLQCKDERLAYELSKALAGVCRDTIRVEMARLSGLQSLSRNERMPV